MFFLFQMRRTASPCIIHQSMIHLEAIPDSITPLKGSSRIHSPSLQVIPHSPNNDKTLANNNNNNDDDNSESNDEDVDKFKNGNECNWFVQTDGQTDR